MRPLLTHFSCAQRQSAPAVRWNILAAPSAAGVSRERQLVKQFSVELVPHWNVWASFRCCRWCSKIVKPTFNSIIQSFSFKHRASSFFTWQPTHAKHANADFKCVLFLLSARILRRFVSINYHFNFIRGLLKNKISLECFASRIILFSFLRRAYTTRHSRAGQEIEINCRWHFRRSNFTLIYSARSIPFSPPNNK